MFMGFFVFFQIRYIAIKLGLVNRTWATIYYPVCELVYVKLWMCPALLFLVRLYIAFIRLQLFPLLCMNNFRFRNWSRKNFRRSMFTKNIYIVMNNLVLEHRRRRNRSWLLFTNTSWMFLRFVLGVKCCKLILKVLDLKSMVMRAWLQMFIKVVLTLKSNDCTTYFTRYLVVYKHKSSVFVHIFLLYAS